MGSVPTKKNNKNSFVATSMHGLTSQIVFQCLQHEANFCPPRLDADRRHSHSRLLVHYGRAARSAARPHRRLNAHRPKRSARENFDYCGRAIGVNLWRTPYRPHPQLGAGFQKNLSHGYRAMLACQTGRGDVVKSRQPYFSPLLWSRRSIEFPPSAPEAPATPTEMHLPIRVKQNLRRTSEWYNK